MKVRIYNNGQDAHMTQITDAETGKQLDLRVIELTIKVQDGLPHAILTSVLPVVDVIADAEIKHVCPYCGRPSVLEERKSELQTLIEAVKAWEDGQTRARIERETL